MTRDHDRVGELCLLTYHAGCHDPRNVTDKTTATAGHSVMSRRCAHCRFHSHIQITPTCWIWNGTRYTDKSGLTYGQFMLAGRRTGAHRASYILHVGPIPAGLDILHSCDVKACVNPAHLRPGTHTENIREAFAKLPVGHFAGERNGRARLDWPKVRAIRAALARGEAQDELARQYGVTQAHISHIAHGTRWLEPVQAEAVA